MKKTVFMMLLGLLLFILVHPMRADTIIDTTYSVAEMDGGIGYNTLWGTYGVGTIAGYLVAGDWWDWFNGGNGFTRSFVSFPIPEPPEGYELDSAYIYISRFKRW